MTGIREEGLVGNRWFKINLHVHALGNNPTEIIHQARLAEIDIIAITDHQTFQAFEAVAKAVKSEGRNITVLPGIEITTHEGVHVLAIFPNNYNQTQREHLIGWLEIPGSGNTKVASRKNLNAIVEKVDEDGGIIIIPHPFTEDIGMLDKARKISTKTEWLELDHINLMQVSEDKIKYINRDDDGNWINRYVLKSANPNDIGSSTYCLAPFNRSDAHKPEEIKEGCSWFWMSEPTIEGLRQVACEPRTRISRRQPSVRNHDCILGLKVVGGYCDDQYFAFNDGLNCIIGQNYAGKSAIFDFIRFVLTNEGDLPNESRKRLLRRLNAILGADGKVEIYLRKEGNLYVVRRTFVPEIANDEKTVVRCLDKSRVYLFNQNLNQLDPVDNFDFSIEVYEQGRISRLREDIDRQLEMLDEFAGIGELKKSKTENIIELNKSAEDLKPLYEEKEQLETEIQTLPELEKDLSTKEELISGLEEEKWANTSAVVENIGNVISKLRDAFSEIPDPTNSENLSGKSPFEKLFTQKVPTFDANDVIETQLLTDLSEAVSLTLDEIERARASIVSTIQVLFSRIKDSQEKWEELSEEHDSQLNERLAKAGVDSPKELIQQVNALRSRINAVKAEKRPRLVNINELIERAENEREKLLSNLSNVTKQILRKREEKAKELTESLSEKLIISVEEGADRENYKNTLQDLCTMITSQSRRIQNRDQQIKSIVESILPLDLAFALINDGVDNKNGIRVPLYQVCNITENTQEILFNIAKDIKLLNRLQTIEVPDVPKILVQRRGESEYADLRLDLSQGEQSAAILTLALQARDMPLILDQPEDELGYNYVVHLIVPKILDNKDKRQLLVITHNANIPVLGDADYVLKMENEPRSGNGGRQCIATDVGCFESSAIVNALLELEGGERAFRFRHNRYKLP